ncbi:MAG: hypothetical protein QXH07_01860 [Thermoplasmata archaeon]
MARRKMASSAKISREHSLAMNKARWAKDIKEKHGTMRVTIHSILYEWFSPSVGISNYGIWNLGMIFYFPVGIKLAEKNDKVIASNDRATPEYYKNGMIRETILYRDYRFYTDAGQLRAFNKIREMINRITRDKKVYEELTGITEEEAIKIWNKFVIYRIKRGNKLKVLV